MYLFLVIANALVISLLVIPSMLRVAPRLRMLDQPNEARKIHSEPIARVGGWGIVVGALLPIIVWCPWTQLVLCFVFGALVLLVAGAVDDAFNINHWYKFGAQVVAVAPLVFIADLYVTHLPLFDVAMPVWFAKLFTLVAIVGVINALNHSDGLDGLAGGEALLSLVAVTVLAWLYLRNGVESGVENGADAHLVIIVASAVIGGVLGFLRFNTHPARVFMGDTGSQFLGFALGFLVVLLTQEVDTTLSPAVPALLLGLPVIDILAVVFLRYKNGMHLFLGSRNHVHHRMLDRGLSHYESVVVIYSVQALLVTAGVVMCRYTDVGVLGLYFAVVVLLFSLLTVGERREMRFRPRGGGSPLDELLSGAERGGLLAAGPLWFLAIAIPGYLVGGAAVVSNIPMDFGVVSAGLLALLTAALALNDANKSAAMRVAVYATAVFVVYLVFGDSARVSGALRAVDAVFFGLLALAVGLTIRFARSQDFSATPMDYLVALVVVGVGVLSFGNAAGENVGLMVIKCIIMLYACEVLMVQRVARWSPLNISAVVALCCVSVRGLFSI